MLEKIVENIISKKMVVFYFIFLLILLMIVNIPTILTLIFYLLIVLLLNKITLKVNKIKLLNVFFIYVIISVFIYLGHLYNLPLQLGFSGDGAVIGAGYGTDDSFFYSLAVKELPSNFPLRPKINAWRGKFYFYSSVLKYVGNFLKLFIKISPLDLIIFNSIILSFNPFLLEKISYKLFKDEKVSKSAFSFILICPIILSSGLILLRDGIVSTFIMFTIYFYFENKNIKMLISLLTLGLIRISSGIQGILVIYILSFKNKTNFKNIFLKLFTLLIILIIPLIFEKYIREKTGGSLFYRKNYVDGFLTKVSGDGILLKLQSLPMVFKVPATMLFFLMTPVFDLKSIYFKNVFLVTKFMNLYYPFLFVFYISYFIKALFRINKNKNLKLIVISFLIILYVVSQISLQMRHKTLYMPLLYLIISYGKHTKVKKEYKIIGFVGSFVYLLLNIYKII